MGMTIPITGWMLRFLVSINHVNLRTKFNILGTFAHILIENDMIIIADSN